MGELQIFLIKEFQNLPVVFGDKKVLKFLQKSNSINFPINEIKNFIYLSQKMGFSNNKESNYKIAY